MFLCRQTIPLTFAIQALLCARRLAEAVTPKLDVAIGGNDGGGWRVERREQGWTNVLHKKQTNSSKIRREL